MFSATKGAGVRKLVTETFTSTTLWTPPSFLNRVETVSGYGAPATADTPTSGEVGYGYAAGPSADPQPNPPYALWETLDAAADNIVSIIAGNVGTNFISLPSPQYFVDSSDGYSVITYPNSQWIIGSGSSKVQRGSHPSTGNILASQLASGGNFGWFVSASYIALGNAGNFTLTNIGGAPGLGFPGGTLAGTEPYRTAVPAVTTTYTNVAIIPGSTFSIVVPAGGSLTVTYFV
jgi:hypothetical protein